ncbi:pyruvate dehydrogenase isoenzyme [Cyclospora cayetanensis]|uniref:Protein-serine/threonine kinase n=1 Tax=Cyclospora cayetanensis TaxID=88456 RepID=A0A1D3D4J0_9EIME|nr:pyruvate dehydrogenase isoenzyme [Cyclospora cayetanensis]
MEKQRLSLLGYFFPARLYSCTALHTQRQTPSTRPQSEHKQEIRRLTLRCRSYVPPNAEGPHPNLPVLRSGRHAATHWFLTYQHCSKSVSLLDSHCIRALLRGRDAVGGWLHPSQVNTHQNPFIARGTPWGSLRNFCSSVEEDASGHVTLSKERLGKRARASLECVIHRVFLGTALGPALGACSENYAGSGDLRGHHLNTRPSDLEGGAPLQDISFSEFLYHELPVRHTYVESFKQLRTTSAKDLDAFRKVVLNLKQRHAPIVPMLVTGMRNLRKVAPQFFTEEFVDEFLDGFFLSRIGTEMLTSSYLTPKGVVDMDTEKLCHSHYGRCPKIKNAMRATIDRYPAPSGGTVDNSKALSCSGAPGELSTELRRMQSWTEHTEPPSRCVTPLNKHSENLVETARKSAVPKPYLHAETISQGEPQYETADEIADPNLPPVQLLVAGDDHSVSIRLSDMGGGITNEAQPRIWSYMYTTAKPVKYDPLSGAVASLPMPPYQPQQERGPQAEGPPSQSVTIGSLDFTTKEKKQLMISPLAGFGCGLPLCRLYASYLRGSLTVVSMPSHGTDAYVHLKRIGDQKELMPPSNAWIRPRTDGLSDQQGILLDAPPMHKDHFGGSQGGHW